MFDLAEMLKNANVPESGTSPAPKLLELPLDDIHADARNFYSMDAGSLDELAASIELVGLQQPLLVRRDGGGYTVVSGHRRLAALTRLHAEGKGFDNVPCLLDESARSEAWQELALIYGNSATRKLSSADLAEQAKRVTELLYKLKEEGVEFPGRMRDHVAEACSTTKTKLAMLKCIDEKLTDERARLSWKAGKMADASAYALSKLEPWRQKLICDAFAELSREKSVDWIPEWRIREKNGNIENLLKIKCPLGGACNGLERRMLKKPYISANCECSCCKDCADIANCAGSCLFCDEEKAERKELDKAKRQELDKAKRESAIKRKAEAAEAAELAEALWDRIGDLCGKNRVEPDSVYWLLDPEYEVPEEDISLALVGKQDFSDAFFAPFSLTIDQLKAIKHACRIFRADANTLLGIDLMDEEDANDEN